MFLVLTDDYKAEPASNSYLQRLTIEPYLGGVVLEEKVQKVVNELNPNAPVAYLTFISETGLATIVFSDHMVDVALEQLEEIFSMKYSLKYDADPISAPDILSWKIVSFSGTKMKI